MKDIIGRRVILKKKGGVRRRLGRQHWDEFGRTKEVGTVLGHIEYPPGNFWPEYEVRWDCGLRYSYKRDHLEVLP